MGGELVNLLCTDLQGPIDMTCTTCRCSLPATKRPNPGDSLILPHLPYDGLGNPGPMPDPQVDAVATPRVRLLPELSVAPLPTSRDKAESLVSPHLLAH